MFTGKARHGDAVGANDIGDNAVGLDCRCDGSDESDGVAHLD